VHAYNHNLNTSEANYAKICSTHTFADRVDTVGVARDAGLSPCSGAIFGMDESDEEIVDLAFDLRKLDPDSVPINFLIPFEGTPMGGKWQLTPNVAFAFWPSIVSSFPTLKFGLLEDVRFTCEVFKPRTSSGQFHLLG